MRKKPNPPPPKGLKKALPPPPPAPPKPIPKLTFATPTMADGYVQVKNEDGQNIGIVIYQATQSRWLFRPAYGFPLSANELEQVAALVRAISDVDP